jgi:LacI family transcriptional regulator, galactose operon repressor
MPTILDVAARAGVSVKTVSRVMNDHKNVSAKTRGRVHEAMRELRYHPSDAARQLRGRATSNIGLLLGDLSSGYQTRFHRAMLEACLEAGRFLCVELFEGPRDGWEVRIRDLLERANIGDMILLPPLCDFAPLKQLLRAQHVNCVLISPSSPDPHNAAVMMDDRTAAREITSRLIELGHRRIGHIMGDPDHVASGSRRIGFLDAFATNNLPRPEPELIVQGDFRFKQGRVAAEQLLRLADPPTAIFAANDDTAAAASMAAHSLGLQIPLDLSVVGFDDSPIASEIWPSLTTVRQPFEAMAASAVRILALSGHGLRQEPSVRAVLEPHTLVERESSGPAPTRSPAR